MLKFRYVLSLLMLVLLGGCAHVDVSHLNSQPWKLDIRRTLEMEFMRFDYEVIPRTNSFGVRGMAYVKKSEVPVWAGWIGELWIQGYLSDSDGVVLAQGLQVFSPGILTEGKGLPFDFALKPDSLDAGPLFISFGYRMALYKTRDDVNTLPFMAIEGAVSE